MKIIFESSIFLHQSEGGISRYIFKINETFQKKNINSIIYSPISINNNLNIKKNYNVSYFKFKKIPRFCTKLFYLINNLATFFFINLCFFGRLFLLVKGVLICVSYICFFYLKGSGFLILIKC